MPSLTAKQRAALEAHSAQLPDDNLIESALRNGMSAADLAAELSLTVDEIHGASRRSIARRESTR